MTEWWRQLSGFVKFVCAPVIALAAVTAAWGTLGWPVPASQAFIRVEVGKVAKVVIELARAERFRLRISREELIARRASITDPQSREAIERLILRDEEAIADVESRIAALERLRSD